MSYSEKRKLHKQRANWKRVLTVLKLLAVMTAVFGVCSAALIPRWAKRFEKVVYTPSDLAFPNPYMGYAGWAINMPARYVPEPDVTLAFALLYWKDFEPEKGVYDFESFEQTHNFRHLTAKNVKYIIRFICDYPTQEAHMDIPQWLYDEMGGAGTAYARNGVCGFAPDYANAYLIERHALAIAALGQRYDASPDVAFIQLGSLGQWGEWHNTTAGLDFYGSEVTDLYVKHYIQAFSETKLQMRRPFEIMRGRGIGLYNDMIGHQEATYNWIDWVDVLELVDYYNSMPIGGEFASTYSLDDYFGHLYPQVKQMTLDSHTTYIVSSPPKSDNSQDLLKTMGYRLTAETVYYSNELFRGNTIDLVLSIKNTGLAPFYYQWPFCYLFFRGDGTLLEKHTIDLDVTDILPGHTVAHRASLPVTLPAGTYTIKLGLINPHTGEPEVMFANAEAEPNRLLPIGVVNIK